MSNNYPTGLLHSEFLPATSEDERPAVRVGGVLVFVYQDDDGTVRVTVDTEDHLNLVSIKINVNNGTVWEGEA